MKNIFYILLVSLVLQGCVAGAFVAGGAATGGIISDPRPIGIIKSDEEINYKVNKALANDPALSSQTHISAVSYNRVVLLTGQAYDDELRARAENYARSAPGVRRVFNKISVGIPTDAMQRTKDIGITSALKMKMFANRALKSNHFKIVTENGVVFILGVATHEQADMAIEIARESAGVKRVVKLIEYT